MKFNERSSGLAAKQAVWRIRVGVNNRELCLIDYLNSKAASCEGSSMSNPEFNVERFAKVMHSVRT